MLADRSVVTGGKIADEFVRVRGFGGGNDLGFAGAEPAERDVVADRAAEQLNDLADIGDLVPQRAARHRGDVLAVDQDAAGLDGVETQNQIEHGGLATARRSDQRRELAGLRHEVHGAQHRRAGTIGEPHVGKFEAPGVQRQRRMVVVVQFAGRAVDDFIQNAHADKVVVADPNSAAPAVWPVRRRAGTRPGRKQIHPACRGRRYRDSRHR